jgi:hypothetical protein
MKSKSERKNKRNGGMKFTPKKEKLATISAVKSMIANNQSILMKYIDTTNYLVAIGTNSTSYNVVMPTTGTGEINMNGTSISMQKLDLRFDITQYNVAVALTDRYQLRFTIVQSKGTDSLAIGDIYQESATAGTILSSPFRYDTHNLSFRVLHDSKMQVNNYQPCLTKELLGLNCKAKTRYDVFNTEWSNGQISYIVTVVSYPGANTNVTWNLNFRMWFYDV